MSEFWISGPLESRGYLPHLRQNRGPTAVTFRLADSLPQHVVMQWKKELRSRKKQQRRAEMEARIEKYLDAGHGACWLRRPKIAELVQQALLHFDGDRYRLHSWVVMPNHVHVLQSSLGRWDLDRVVHSWKSFTATKANRMLGRTGTFWQREYYDRAIRDEHHLRVATRYIEANPVKAGLCAAPGDWPWSGAFMRARGLWIEKGD